MPMMNVKKDVRLKQQPPDFKEKMQNNLDVFYLSYTLKVVEVEPESPAATERPGRHM